MKLLLLTLLIPIAAALSSCSESSASPGHEFAPPRYFHPSLGHVSYPNSPGCGRVWKDQRNAPVRTS